MNKKQREAKMHALSPRAFALYTRVCDPNRFYKAHDGFTPKSMAELMNAGLVDCSGRVARIVLCYTPAGVKSFKLEQYPNLSK